MPSLVQSEWFLGALQLPHRLIQGPLAGYSCAPFRSMFSAFQTPAYAVSEMISATDVLTKHTPDSRYLARWPEEGLLAYQLAGNDPQRMADAAAYLQMMGADLIDINCGCPKKKIRKKGLGSALLEQPETLLSIIKAMRAVLDIPLTVKIRIQDEQKDLYLAKAIEDAGADALIVHGRGWQDDYDKPLNLDRIAQIKKTLSIPLIGNGDVRDEQSLQRLFQQTGCDAVMIARAGCGRPWLYQSLLSKERPAIGLREQWRLFQRHIEGLAYLEDEYQALLQSRSLIRYYLRDYLEHLPLQAFYHVKAINQFEAFFNEVIARHQPQESVR